MRRTARTWEFWTWMISPCTERSFTERSDTSSTTPWRLHGSIDTRSPTSNQFSKNISSPAIRSQRTRWTANPRMMARNAPPAIVSTLRTPLMTRIERMSATPKAR
jgi:hypothetical protein